MAGNAFVKTSIEKSVQDLPALPAIVTRVLRETESPTACAQSIERLIASDQALTSKVLRVVNSAYYGLSGQVSSLSQAIVILGLQQIRNLVLSVSAFSTMKPKTPRQHEILRVFWLHSFGTAACTQLIAKTKRFNVQDTETAFVGGLLHDIGRLFLFSNFTQTYDQVIRYSEEKGMAVDVAEQKLLGLSHSDVGAQMATQWRLPKPLIEMIGAHEGPFTGEIAPMLYAIHVSDWITKDLYFESNEALVAPMDDQVRTWLGYSDEEIEDLREVVNQKVEEASTLFGLLAAA